MADLHEVIGAIISGVDRGRAQADAAAVQVAQAYKQNPLLASFPVPHVTVDNIVIDLKVAVDSMQSPTTTTSNLTPSLNEIESEVRAFVQSNAVLTELNAKFPLAKKAVDDSITATIADIRGQSALLTQSNPAMIADYVASKVKDSVLASASSTRARVDNGSIRSLIGFDVSHLKSSLATKLSALPTPSTDAASVSVLVTANELQSVPPEKITNVRLSLTEADRSWTTVQNEDGTSTDKLVVH